MILTESAAPRLKRVDVFAYSDGCRTLDKIDIVTSSIVPEQR